MAVAVVELFEVVDIDQAKGLRVAAVAQQLRFKEEFTTVVDIGERIEEGRGLELFNQQLFLALQRDLVQLVLPELLNGVADGDQFLAVEGVVAIDIHLTARQPYDIVVGLGQPTVDAGAEHQRRQNEQQYHQAGKCDHAVNGRLAVINLVARGEGFQFEAALIQRLRKPAHIVDIARDKRCGIGLVGIDSGVQPIGNLLKAFSGHLGEQRIDDVGDLSIVVVDLHEDQSGAQGVQHAGQLNGLQIGVFANQRAYIDVDNLVAQFRQ